MSAFAPRTTAPIRSRNPTEARALNTVGSGGPVSADGGGDVVRGRGSGPEASNGVFTLLTCRASAADHELAVDVALDLPDPHAIPGRVARVDGLALLGSEDLQLGPGRNLPDERARAAWSHPQAHRLGEGA